MSYGQIQKRIKAGQFVGEEEQIRLCATILHLHADIAGNTRDALVRSDMTLDQASGLINDMFGLSGIKDHMFTLKDTEISTVGEWVASDLHPSVLKTDLFAIHYMYYRKNEDDSIVYLQCEPYADGMYEKMLGLRVRKRVAMLKDMPVNALSLMGIDWQEMKEDLTLEDILDKPIVYHYDGFEVETLVEEDCVDLEGIVSRYDLDDAVLEMFNKKEYVVIHEQGHDILEECHNNEEFISFLKAYENKEPKAISLARKHRWK